MDGTVAVQKNNLSEDYENKTNMNSQLEKIHKWKCNKLVKTKTEQNMTKVE